MTNYRLLSARKREIKAQQEVVPTGRSIAATLVYMSKVAHPTLTRFGVRHIRLVKNSDNCANDFSGCVDGFKFVEEQCAVDATELLQSG